MCSVAWALASRQCSKLPFCPDVPRVGARQRLLSCAVRMLRSRVVMYQQGREAGRGPGTGMRCCSHDPGKGGGVVCAASCSAGTRFMHACQLPVWQRLFCCCRQLCWQLDASLVPCLMPGCSPQFTTWQPAVTRCPLRLGLVPVLVRGCVSLCVPLSVPRLCWQVAAAARQLVGWFCSRHGCRVCNKLLSRGLDSQ